MPAKKSTTTDLSATPPATKAAAKKAAAKKAAAKKTPAKKTTATKKTATKANVVKAAAAVPEPSPPRPTRDQIAHAAYLNYRKRNALGLPGDPATDWIEAERQLAEFS